MRHGPEDPSQRATKSTIQRYPGEGFHCYNQGGVCVFFVIFDLAFHLIAFAPRWTRHLTCWVFFLYRQHPDEKRLEGLSKQLDWDVRTIQRWFRQRRNQEKPSTLARFCESMWGKSCSIPKLAAIHFSLHVIASRFVKMNLHRLLPCLWYAGSESITVNMMSDWFKWAVPH